MRHRVHFVTLCQQCRGYRALRVPKRTRFPHGLSATEPLVAPSVDGSTPLTDSLPRSVLLDPTTYEPKENYRGKPPGKKGADPITLAEKRLMENPFAKILASPIRQDSMAQHLLIKFSMFYDKENDSSWLLPSEFPPRHQSRGNYRLLRKSAIDELGGRTAHKKWMALGPWSIKEHVRRKLIWRDGMSEYILSRLREEARRRVQVLARKLLYHVTVDDELKSATIHEPVKKRTIIPRNTSSTKGVLNDGMELLADVVTDPNPNGGPKISPNGSEKPLMEGTSDQKSTRDINRPRQVCQIPPISPIPQSENPPESDRNNQTDQLDSIDAVEEAPLISAILYLSPPDDSEVWEFKSISIENQTASAIIFNLRRLLPLEAESFMSQLVGSNRAVAVMSSDLSVIPLHYLLRVGFYLDGEQDAGESPDRESRDDETPDQTKDIEE